MPLLLSLALLADKQCYVQLLLRVFVCAATLDCKRRVFKGPDLESVFLITANLTFKSPWNAPLVFGPQ